MRITTKLCGLAVALIAAACIGCGSKPAKPTDAGAHADHPHEGPHHGAIVEWGDEEYHVEFTVDHSKQEATVYILGGDVKTAKPIKVEAISLSIKQPAFQVELKAAPQAGDPAGSASCFVGKHENFAKEQEFAGTISGKVDGKPYAGDFKEEADSHGHEHK